MWMNSISLYGKLCAEPKDYGFKEGYAEKVVVLRVSSMGIKPDDIFWIDCICFGKTAEAALAKLRKGDAIAVNGRLYSKKFKKRDGSDGESWTISAREIQFLPQPREEEPIEVDTDSCPF